VLAEFSRLWPWLLACFAIGVAAGAFTRRAPANGVLARWLIWTALAFGVGVLLVRLGALAAAAVLLEGALAAYALFILGAALGALVRHRSMWAHEGWAVGLIAAALVWVGAVVISPPDQVSRSRYIPQMETAGIATTTAPAPPAAEPATAGPVASSVDAPAASAGAAPPAAGALTLTECQTALAASSTPDELAFRKGGARLTSSAKRALDRAAEIIRRCPENATIDVRGHVRGSRAKASNDALAQRRAETAASYLRRQGVSGRRLLPSRGESEQPEGRALTFEVR